MFLKIRLNFPLGVLCSSISGPGCSVWKTALSNAGGKSELNETKKSFAMMNVCSEVAMVEQFLVFSVLLVKYHSG